MEIRDSKKHRLWITTVLLVVLIISILSILYSHTYASIEDIKKKVESTRAEIIELEKIIKALDDSIKNREKRIEELSQEYLETETQLKVLEVELVQSESRLKEKNRIFAGRVRSAYIKGWTSYLELFLESENFGDVIIRMAYLTRILNRDAELINSVKNEQALIKKRKTEIASKRQKLLELRSQKDGEYRNLVDQRREKDNLLASVKKRLAVELVKITPQAERKPVYGIVIDNHSSARPQHGLAKASLIYEYEVEGGITRYLALFSSFPTKVGPIRSARSHSIILAMENSVNYIYASAGTDILIKIKDWKVNSTNAITSGNPSFFRDSSRKAPHNLYVNLATLGVEEPSKEVVIRPAYLSRQGNEASEVILEYSSIYSVRYEYLSKKGVYRRYVNGELHRDATKEEILARNIIVQYVPHGLDILRRPTPKLVGKGKIEFYSQGQQFSGTWIKDSNTSPTRFYYQDGRELERVYGQTWIQIVRIPRK
ncbi:MAG: putative lipoprotein YerB [candidate division WS2 bacterium]|nr:putative lipoprotein YerB [Candidatus Lithacetigena glycinireducens]